MDPVRHEPYEGTLAEVAFDELGYSGIIDPATSIMAVDDGWLSLVVRAPEGEVDVQLGTLFKHNQRLRLRWEGADGDGPGRCVGAPTPVTLDAEIAITVLEADGSALIEMDDVQTEIMGCGTAVTESETISVHAGTCTLSIVRRRKSLPSQVTDGGTFVVTATAGATTPVTLYAPPPPDRLRLPDLDETLLLLDVAAFSGADVVADSLDLVVDDVLHGRWRPEVVEVWRDAADNVQDADDVGPMAAIAASWGMWAEIQDLREDEAPSSSGSETP